MCDLLDRGSLLMWPKRSAQELLFDLGERKKWDETQRLAAVASCAAWWSRWGVGPKNPQPFGIDVLVGSAGHPGNISSKKQSFIEALGKRQRPLQVNLTTCTKDVSKQPQRLVSEQTELITVGCYASRYIQQPLPKGFLYHRRSIAHLNEALDVCYGHLQIEQMDTADAMLLFSLISHWQRRRPTQEVRANRQKEQTRRATPKPIARLLESLLARGRFQPNLDFASEHSSPSIVSLLSELALTNAFLASHTPRRTKDKTETPDSTGQEWLDAIKDHLSKPEVRALVECEADFFDYRAQVMRAYLLKENIFPPLPETIPKRPYISSLWALNVLYIERKSGVENERSPEATSILQSLLSREDWEGKAMQASQIQSTLEKRNERIL